MAIQPKKRTVRPDPTGARDDAEAAFQPANFCDYRWAQFDARALLDRAKSANA